MKSLLLAVLLLAASAIPAFAQALDIGWDDAPSRGGTANRLFDCNTNTGSNTFVVTFTPPVDLLGVTELEATVNVAMGEIVACSGPCYPPPLAPWWDLRPGRPRAGAMTASADFLVEPWASSSTVENPWAGCVSSATAYRVETTYHGYADSSQVGVQDIFVAPPLGTTIDLLAGHEYFIVHGTIRNAHATGDGACAGCCQPARLFAEITVARGSGFEPYPIAMTDQPIAWNGWRNGACNEGVPARASTWGAIKSRYR